METVAYVQLTTCYMWVHRGKLRGTYRKRSARGNSWVELRFISPRRGISDLMRQYAITWLCKLVGSTKLSRRLQDLPHTQMIGLNIFREFTVQFCSHGNISFRLLLPSFRKLNWVLQITKSILRLANASPITDPLSPEDQERKAVTPKYEISQAGQCLDWSLVEPKIFDPFQPWGVRENISELVCKGICCSNSCG